MAGLFDQDLLADGTDLIVLAISLCAGLMAQLLYQDFFTYGTDLIVLTISGCAGGVVNSRINLFATVRAVHCYITEFLSRSILVGAGRFCGYAGQFLTTYGTGNNGIAGFGFNNGVALGVGTSRSDVAIAAFCQPCSQVFNYIFVI